MQAGRWPMEKGSQSVGIVEVTRDNWQRIRPTVLEAIENASFVAIDTEFSGLGDDKKGRLAKHMEDRYQSITNVVRTHSLLQFGLSIFRRTFKSAPPTVGGTTSATVPEACTYDVQTFNFWLLANEEFTVTPSSLRFLAESGLDFNFLFAKGIRFTPQGSPLKTQAAQPVKKKKGKRDSKDVEETADLASLIERLIESKTSIILHNGLLDLLYIYHNFIGPLPSSFASFTGQLCNLFPRVYDTKYIADYHTEESASYLEYLYYKCERNSESSSLHVVSPAVCTVVIAPEIWNHKAAATPSKQTCCVQYARHGYCPDGAGCSLSHDIERILDMEESKKSKKRKRNQNNNNKPERGEAKPKIQKIEEETSKTVARAEDKGKEKMKEEEENGGVAEGEKDTAGAQVPSKDLLPPDVHVGKMHSAGFDSFATGFIYGQFFAKFGAKELHGFGNNVYLVGKDFPLKLQKSVYSG